MINLISSLSSPLATLLVQVDVAKGLPIVPSLNFSKPDLEGVDPEALKPDPKEMAAYDPPEETKEELTKATEDLKKQQEEMINDATSQCKEAFQEKLGILNEMGIEMGNLQQGSVKLVSRLAMVPPAIIVATPMGPGVSPQLAMPMIQQLQQEGNVLSTSYDKITNIKDKLGLDGIADIVKSLPILSSIPGIDAAVGIISTVTTLITAVQSVAKPLILAVGASVGGSTATEPSAPSQSDGLGYNGDPKTCARFFARYIPQDKDGKLLYDQVEYSADNCTAFCILSSEKGDSPDCNNCTRYKEKG